VQHAALWVRYAGERLRALSADGCRMPENMGACGERYAERGWTGFSEERWQVWREELRRAGEGMAGDGLVRAAVDKMEELQ
jgi:hypothetical protein